jgi:hypothetical protein
MATKRGTPTRPASTRPPAEPLPPQKVKPLPTQGLLGATLAEKLKQAPTGTSDDAIVMETLRSAPVDQLKAALTQAPPKARNQLFSALPADQIRSILGTLPASVLAPAEPPAPPPSPTGGPAATIPADELPERPVRPGAG